VHEEDDVCPCRDRCAARLEEGQREKGDHQHEPDKAELGQRLELERMRIEGAAARLDQARARPRERERAGA
jgi:hypothetical protein